MDEADRILGYGSGTNTWFHIMGRTVGAIVCTGFGSYSMYFGIVAVIQHARTAWFYAIGTIAAILLIWSITQLAAFRRLPRPAANKQYRRRYAILFNAVVAIEVAAIILGGPILSHYHRQDLYPQWVGLVVGIHFLPLGKLFQMRLYYVTGFVISLFALGSLLFAQEALRLAVNAAGTGLTLWTTAVIILTKNLACLPAKSAFGASGSA